MESNAFASLATLQLPSASRLLATACCPDKDLVLLISRLGGQDRISLWKVQGSKTWEVDVGHSESSGAQITAVAWSPDGVFASGVLCVTFSCLHFRTEYRNCSPSPLHHTSFP